MDRPENLDPLAATILERLRRNPASSEIILGGYFGLQHYLNYRQTHDIDAWWRGRASVETERAIRDVMRQVAAERGARYQERRFGETLSFEIAEPDGRRMSLQIAVRDIALDAPQDSPWPPILIESLRDNLASKMNALVNRGAPRDFLDIHKAVDARLIGVEECWRLWSLKNPGQRVADAKGSALLNLENLAQRRPLEQIQDPAARAQAQAVRDWFRRQFLPVTALEARGSRPETHAGVMPMELDASLYPDREVPPSRLDEPGEKADYLHRLCSAMDFQIFPEPATLQALAGWQEIFDRYPLPASPAYRALPRGSAGRR